MLGLGLGGLVDGILLHQILQWHHMLTSTPGRSAKTLQGLESNMLADGLFHAVAWVVVVAGIMMLWSVMRRSGARGRGSALFGWVLAGWGIFNIVEGVIDHHVLQLHHVRPGPQQTLYDVGFLVVGVLLVFVGTIIGRSDRSSMGHR